MFKIILLFNLLASINCESFLEGLENKIESDVSSLEDFIETDVPIVDSVEEGNAIIARDKLDKMNDEWIPNWERPDLFSVLPANYTGPITLERFPYLSKARIEREIYIRE